MRIDIFEDFVPRALRYVLSHFRRICVHAQYGGKLIQLLTTSYFPPPGSLSSTISLEPVLLEESEALFLPLSLENRSGNLQTAHDVQHNPL